MSAPRSRRGSHQTCDGQPAVTKQETQRRLHPRLPRHQQSCVLRQGGTRDASASQCRTRASGASSGARQMLPEQQQVPSGRSAQHSRPGDKRRHTAYVISTTGGARPVSLTAKRRDSSKAAPFSRRELERLIDPHTSAHVTNKAYCKAVS